MAYIIEAQKLEKSRRWTKKLVCLKNDYIPSTFKGISPKSVKINWSNYNEKRFSYEITCINEAKMLENKRRCTKKLKQIKSTIFF